MGEMADMLLDNFEMDAFDGEDPILRKPTQCRGCDTTNVSWQRINNHWILTNPNGAPHRCGKYSLPLDVLKDLEQETRQKIKQCLADKIFTKSLSHNGISKMLVFITNEQLVALYSRWVAYNQSQLSNTGYLPYGYKEKILELETEILKRMNKL